MKDVGLAFTATFIASLIVFSSSCSNSNKNVNEKYQKIWLKNNPSGTFFTSGILFNLLLIE